MNEINYTRHKVFTKINFKDIKKHIYWEFKKCVHKKSNLTN